MPICWSTIAKPRWPLRRMALPMNSVNNPRNGDPIRINTQTGKVVDGNGRTYELLRRASMPGSSITPDTTIYYEPYTPSAILDPWEEPPDPWNPPNGE